MKGLNHYLELVENGRDLARPPRPAAIQESVLQLLGLALKEGKFEAQGAWQLDARVSRRLEKLHDTSPPGGWARLCALCCGCGVLRPARAAFEPGLQLQDVLALNDAQLRRRLCEAFTQKLAPPASAAGLFMMLGVHPAWGLWVAHSIHHRRADAGKGVGQPGAGQPGWRDASIFEPHTAHVIEQAIFSAIAVAISALRKLDPAQRYPIDAFAALTRAGCRFARASAEAQLRHTPPLGLPPFLADLDRATGPHHQDFAAADLISSVLVPAGVLHTFDDGSFCVIKDSLANVQVGPFDVAAQELRLVWMLAGQPECRVA